MQHFIDNAKGSNLAKMQRLPQEVEQMAVEMAVEGERYQQIAEKMGLEKAGKLSTYRKLFPEFEAQLQDGVLTYCEYLEEELLQLPHKYDKDTAKLLSANIIKILEFRHPKRYSPRQQVDFNVSIDIAGALERAQNRVIDVGANILQLSKAKK